MIVQWTWLHTSEQEGDHGTGEQQQAVIDVGSERDQADGCRIDELCGEQMQERVGSCGDRSRHDEKLASSSPASDCDI
jgi:hypothetical protein